LALVLLCNADEVYEWDLIPEHAMPQDAYNRTASLSMDYFASGDLGL
jgi:hypothetical protein